MQMKITMKYTYTPIKMAKSRMLTTLIASKDAEHHLLLVGLQDGIGNLEDSLVASYENWTYSYTIQQSCTFIFTQRSWKLNYTHTKIHT